MQRTLRRLLAVSSLLALILAPVVGAASEGRSRVDVDFLLAPGYRLVPGDYAAGVPDTLVPHHRHFNLYTDVAPRNPDGTINAVIEIPQGDDKKFETNVDTGRLFWELKNGAPRLVKYVGYPANYGMAPGTLGGDGDPLDVLVLGGMELRGAVSAAKIVAVMRMVDGGDLDDKLIAVLPGSYFDGKSLADLEAAGVTAILKTWFESYKGPGEIQVTGFEGAAAAELELDAAIANYQATR
jgi:inorganic pyrophosphatase